MLLGVLGSQDPLSSSGKKTKKVYERIKGWEKDVPSPIEDRKEAHKIYEPINCKWKSWKSERKY